MNWTSLVSISLALATQAAESPGPNAHEGAVLCVAFSPDGQTLASSGDDKLIRLWDVAAGRERWALRGHSGAVHSVAFSPDGRRLASAGDDGKLKIWDVHRGELIHTLEGHARSVRSVAFHPTDTLLASAGLDRRVRFWDPAAGQYLRELNALDTPANVTVFSPDGTASATGTAGGLVQLYNTATGRLTRTLRAHSQSVTSLAFSPTDTQLLASGGQDNTIRFWNADSGQEVGKLELKDWDITCMAFSPDGQRLAVASWLGPDTDLVKIVRVADGQTLQSLDGHASTIASVAFSPDGASLASGSWDQIVKIWNLETGQSVPLVAAGNGPEIFTIDDQRIVGSLQEVRGGSLVVQTGGGRQSIPLDDLVEIKFPEAEPPAASPSARVHLVSNGQLNADVLSLSNSELGMRNNWAGELSVPLTHVRGVVFNPSESPHTSSASKFSQQLAQPGESDVILVQTTDGRQVTVTGTVLGLTGDKLQVEHGGKTRTIGRSRVLGVVFSTRGRSPATDAPYQLFSASASDRLPGTWTSLDEAWFELKTLWDATLRLPAKKISTIRTVNGRVVYLSDLEPTSVEQIPYFDRVMPYRRNENLDGEPLALDGRTYSKGLAVHSKCRLTYATLGRYEAFNAVVGFADGSPPVGHVVCRVVDEKGQSLFREELRSQDAPQTLDLDISGVQQLTLEIDFGQFEDIGDRILWADARIFRQRSAANPPTAGDP